MGGRLGAAVWLEEVVEVCLRGACLSLCPLIMDSLLPGFYEVNKPPHSVLSTSDASCLNSGPQ